MITPEDRKKHEHYTGDTILAIKVIQGLTNKVLRKYIREDKQIFQSLKTLLGGKSNPNWILATIAEEMFARDMIDEEEYDKLSA